MRRFGPHALHSDPGELEARRRVLSAIGDGRLSGFEVARALAAADASGGAPADAESFLYPTLHRLEADSQLEAAWMPNASGAIRRTYVRRGR